MKRPKIVEDERPRIFTGTMSFYGLGKVSSRCLYLVLEDLINTLVITIVLEDLINTFVITMVKP